MALDEAVRWARERGLSFIAPARASMTNGAMKDRTARMTVLTWNAPGAPPCNLFTFIRHRRLDTLGPWACESDQTWAREDLEPELRLFSLDASLERCQALVDHILDSGTLEIDGLEIHYALESIPRRHWAYRDDRSLTDASVRSPFTRHSAEIIEYWSFAAEPHKRWLEMLESYPANWPPRLRHLGFPLKRRPDRVGNLMVAGAEDAMTCTLEVRRDRTLRLSVDADELLPGAYHAMVWASYSGDEVLRRELPGTPGQTVIELASGVDHIGFAIHRAVDGQCVDLMEAFLIMEVKGVLEVEAGPMLHLRNLQSRTIHQVKPSALRSTLNVRFNSDNADLDKGIRRLWLDLRLHEREAAARREGNFVRFRPTEFNQAVQHFIGLLRQDSDQTAPIYLADPYFMHRLGGDKGEQLYLNIFAATTGRSLRILCTQMENNDARPWWLNYPNLLTAHVTVRSFLERDERGKPGFHDRYLITPEREVVITHSFNGWDKQGVTFASHPYGVYRAEAEQLWLMDVGSVATPLLVREIG